jgi:hypothetical protein
MVRTRKTAGGTELRKKATFLLRTELLQAMDEAVNAGMARSKNAFVEEALDRALADIRRRERRERLEAASRDPLFLRDIAGVECDFRFADAETARGIM